MLIIPLLSRRLLYTNLFDSKQILIIYNFKRKSPLQFMNIVTNKLSFYQCLSQPGNYFEVPLTAKRRLRICSNLTQKVCWNCTKTFDNATIFCNACSCLQPVDGNANLFEIIGIKRSFKINHQDLKQKYRSLQSILHPDKFSNKSKKEQELSEECSSLVNKAYSTLLDPLERGLYILKLQNMTVEENTIEMDKLFLMQIMELNEELENESSPEKISELNLQNKEQIDSLISEVENAFDNDNELLAKELLTKMKYYYSIEKKIKDLKQKLNIPG